MPRQPLGQRVHAWLSEPEGETFRLGKWRFWFIAVAGLQLLNAGLTALIFQSAGNLQNYMGAILLGVGALVGWIAIGALHYSDAPERGLARGVSALDSVTLLFVIAHFAFLMWAYGHLKTIQSEEAKYEAQAEKFNVEARQVQADNAKIAESMAKVSENERQRARIENDTIYQARKAAQAGAKVQAGRTQSAAASLSTSPIELEKPTKPDKTSAQFLNEWDVWIRAANFGELLLCALTLIFIRNTTAKTNSPVENLYPMGYKISTASARQSAPSPALRMSDNERQSLSLSQNAGRLSLSDPDRKDALKKLREHLKAIAFHHPNKWFKADLVRGGVTIRFFERQNGHEIAIAQTTQSDKLLAAVEREDFRERLIEELRRQEFDI